MSIFKVQTPDTKAINLNSSCIHSKEQRQYQTNAATESTAITQIRRA